MAIGTRWRFESGVKPPHSIGVSPFRGDLGRGRTRGLVASLRTLGKTWRQTERTFSASCLFYLHATVWPALQAEPAVLPHHSPKNGPKSSNSDTFSVVGKCFIFRLASANVVRKRRGHPRPLDAFADRLSQSLVHLLPVDAPCPGIDISAM